jgi:hypothetical protein
VNRDWLTVISLAAGAPGASGAVSFFASEGASGTSVLNVPA